MKQMNRLLSVQGSHYSFDVGLFSCGMVFKKLKLKTLSSMCIEKGQCPKASASFTKVCWLFLILLKN